MNFFLSLGVTFMFITSNTQLYSQTNNGGDSLLADAIFATYNEQWSAGLSFMREIEMRQPNSAVSSFYIGSLYFRRLYSTLNHSYKDSAKVHFEKAYSIAEAQYEKDENDEEALFYYGGASGYLGMYHAYDKNYLSAAKYGVKGVKLLKKLLSINPNKYDAYLGLGIYSYSASKAPVYLRWLVSLWGVDTNIKTSFLYLEKAVANGTYARTEAKDKLCNFYLAEKRFPDALTLVHELKSEFPNGSWFNFLEVLIHYKSKNWADVIRYSRTYAELSNKSTAYVRKVTAYQIEAFYHLGQFDSSLAAFAKLNFDTSTDFLSNAIAHFYVARSLEQLGDYNSAKAHFSKAVQLIDENELGEDDDYYYAKSHLK